MEYRCSACHTAFPADAEPKACPKCGAEAGLEPHHAVPMPMRAFGVLLAGVLVASAVGGMLGIFAGA